MPQNSTLNSVIQPRAVCVYSSIQFSKEINTFCKNTLNSLNVTVNHFYMITKKKTLKTGVMMQNIQLCITGILLFYIKRKCVNCNLLNNGVIQPLDSPLMREGFYIEELCQLCVLTHTRMFQHV